MITNTSKQQALADYQAREKTTNRIAQEHNVSMALLTFWAKRAGLPLRRRGRWKTKEPSARTKAFLELSQTLTYAEAGRRCGVSRQSAWRMLKRWGSPSGEVSVMDSLNPVLEPLTDDDLTGDIERLISKTVSPYIDQSNPMLHFDELQAECRAKLAKIIHDGRLSKCATRGKVFAFVKTSFRNHVRSLVQKHAFTAKRTGVEPPKRSPLGVPMVTARKVLTIRLDDPEAAHQVGCYDHALQQAEFIEELFAWLSPSERAEVEALMCREKKHVPGDGGHGHVNGRSPKAIRKAREHLLARCRAILAGVPDNL